MFILLVLEFQTYYDVRASNLLELLIYVFNDIEMEDRDLWTVTWRVPQNYISDKSEVKFHQHLKKHSRANVVMFIRRKNTETLFCFLWVILAGNCGTRLFLSTV